jgi:hypothetical protein
MSKLFWDKILPLIYLIILMFWGFFIAIGYFVWLEKLSIFFCAGMIVNEIWNWSYRK